MISIDLQEGNIFIWDLIHVMRMYIEPTLTLLFQLRGGLLLSGEIRGKTVVYFVTEGPSREEVPLLNVAS